MASELISVVLTQLWQLTLLILVVASLSRWLCSQRPHLAHLLWLVVLIKCVTPPLWASPGGVFCWLQPQLLPETTMTEDVEWTSVAWDELLEVDTGAASNSDRAAAPFAGVFLDESATEELLPREPNNELASTELASHRVGKALVVAWVVVSLLVLTGVTIRWLSFWRLVRNSSQRESPELVAALQTLSHQLRIRRRVRLIVTESLVGPAVVGFFRVTVLIPAVVADRLHGQSIRPILAHELLHIRRGDLWVGLLQTVAQALWWFHPLVWWVGRVTSREAERCCDEEVLGELKCDPASYARALLDVLDLKNQLKPVPVFPGVRPVDVTSNRLERIMSLRQGCRRRSPWWCWLVAIGAAALSLPGAAFVVTAQDDSPQEILANPPAPDILQPAVLLDGSPGTPLAHPRRTQVNAYAVADRDDVTKTVVYNTADFEHLLTGTEAERQQKFEQLVHSQHSARDVQIGWFEGKPIVKATNAVHTEVRKCLSMFIETAASQKVFDEYIESVTNRSETILVCELNVISASDDAYSDLEDAALEHSEKLPWVIPFDRWEEVRQSINHADTHYVSAPQVAVLNGRSVQVESVAQHRLGLKRDDDGTLIPCMNWSGWKTHLLPFQRDDGSFWLGMWFEQGTVVGEKTLSPEETEQPGREGPASIHSYRQLSFAANLDAGQIVVLPGFEISHGNTPTRSTILTVRVRRLARTPSPDAVPSPARFRGTGTTSDAAVQGEVILNLPPAPALAPTIQQTNAQAVEPVDATAPEKSAEKLLLTRQPLGSLFLSIRQRGDGSTSPKTAILLEDADGLDVLIGTADDVRVTSTSASETVELREAYLRSAEKSSNRFTASRIRLIVDRELNSNAQLQMELESAEVQFESNNQSSRLSAERIELLLNTDPLTVEEVKGERLGVLKTDSPVNLNDQRNTARNSTQKILEKRVSVSFPDTPLDEAVKSLAKNHGLNMVLDVRGLEEEGVTSHTLVSIELSGITLQSALKIILEPLNLTTTIDEDGVVMVTSLQRARGHLVAAAYPVADLVVPIPKRVVIRTDGKGTVTAYSSEAATQASPAASEPGEWRRIAATVPAARSASSFDFEKLTRLITQTIQPDSWQEVGGMGIIQSNDLTLSLVIRQTEDVHREISDLLDQLRRLQDVQVALRLESLDVSHQLEGRSDIQATRRFDDASIRFPVE